MRTNKQKVMLHKAFNDGIRTQIRKYNSRDLELIFVAIGADGRLESEMRRKYKEMQKTVEDMEKKYELNEAEQQYYDEHVRDKP